MNAPDPVTRLNAALEGRYRIERELGEGGMATVYLADDLRHERKVALKVLKPELAAVVGAERFLAEIKTTANLQHPHILPLFDSGEADTFLFYVMPYVEGETLRARLDREHQLPVDEAVQIAKNVAEALDYAHSHGVIHRDIKPANILLQSGKPVLSDFGIALAVGVAGAGRLTETGLSLGTPHYMSPEQATGDLSVGAATDIYALGCVLYEMLVGEPPHTGSTAQAILGKIVTGDADPVTKHRRSVPANVDAAIGKSLEKVPADRFTGAQDFAKALGDAGFRHGEGAAAGAGVGSWNRLTTGMTTLAALLAVGLGWSLLLREPPAAPGPVTRVSVRLPEEQSFALGRGSLDLSPDGSTMVYTGVGDGGAQLWARVWDSLDATPLRGTGGPGGYGGAVAISPDGEEIAFLADGSIQIVAIQGGAPRTLVERQNPCCVRWSPDGEWVYYGLLGQSTAGIWRVASSGGSAEVVTAPDRPAGDLYMTHPEVLPGGTAVVFSTVGGGGDRIQVVDVETGEVRDLTRGTSPRYTTTGHLLFLDGGILLAAPFDLESLALTGAPVPLVDGFPEDGGLSSLFAVSETGTLVYRTGVAQRLAVTPVWVERDGSAREIDPGWVSLRVQPVTAPKLSPDGTRMTLSIMGPDGRLDLWVKQLDRGPASRLTFDGQQNFRATWSPDAQSLTFISNRAGEYDVWSTAADGSDAAERVLDRERPVSEALYSFDGAWLVFREGNLDEDIYMVQLPSGSAAVPLEVTEFRELAISLSPDGRWLAYVSDRSGRSEVFVRPFPETATSLHQVSANGGTEPVWARGGRELFYRNGSNELVSVQVSTDAGFVAGRQEVLFDAREYFASPNQATYDVTPDDGRFVMLRMGGQSSEVAAGELILVQNFFEELKARVPNR